MRKQFNLNLNFKAISKFINDPNNTIIHEKVFLYDGCLYMSNSHTIICMDISDEINKHIPAFKDYRVGIYYKALPLIFGDQYHITDFDDNSIELDSVIVVRLLPVTKEDEQFYIRSFNQLKDSKLGIIDESSNIMSFISYLSDIIKEETIIDIQAKRWNDRDCLYLQTEHFKIIRSIKLKENDNSNKNSV